MTSIRCIISVVACSAAACGDAVQDHAVENGLYQLATMSITGDCKLDYALRPGPLAVGSVMPAEVVASAVSVDVRVCGHANEDPSCAGLGESYGFGMARDGDELVGSLLWLVPGCGMPDYTATLDAAGMVTADNELALTWTATISAADPGWTCSGYRPCTSTVEQRMAVTGSGP
jgi:hypothetical protein